MRRILSRGYHPTGKGGRDIKGGGKSGEPEIELSDGLRMTRPEKHLPMRLGTIIHAVRDGFDLDNYYVYTSEVEPRLTEGLTCYIDDVPAIDGDDEEVFPLFVTEKKLQTLYTGQQFRDVIQAAKKRRPSASQADYINALNYYLEHDDFIDF